MGGIRLKKFIKPLLALLLLLGFATTFKSQKVYADEEWIHPRKVIVVKPMKVYQVYIKIPLYKSKLGRHKWIRKGQVVKVVHLGANYEFYIYGKGFKYTKKQQWVIPSYNKFDWFVWYNRHNIKKYLK